VRRRWPRYRVARVGDDLSLASRSHADESRQRREACGCPCSLLQPGDVPAGSTALAHRLSRCRQSSIGTTPETNALYLNCLTGLVLRIRACPTSLAADRVWAQSVHASEQIIGRLTRGWVRRCAGEDEPEFAVWASGRARATAERAKGTRAVARAARHSESDTIAAPAHRLTRTAAAASIRVAVEKCLLLREI